MFKLILDPERSEECIDFIIMYTVFSCNVFGHLVKVIQKFRTTPLQIKNFINIIF